MFAGLGITDKNRPGILIT